jgi:Fe-S-cluster containining protein
MSKPFGITRIRREQLAPGENLCEYCTAKCCRYFALPMDAPETFEEYEYIRWFLLHDRASVFQEDGDWYMLVHTTCKNLRPDNLCGIYETRPKICQDYTTENCEYDDDWTYDFYLESPEQVWEYTEAVLQEEATGGNGIRSRKPNPLAVLA